MFRRTHCPLLRVRRPQGVRFLYFLCGDNTSRHFPINQTTRHRSPDDSSLYRHQRANRKSPIMSSYCV